MPIVVANLLFILLTFVNIVSAEAQTSYEKLSQEQIRSTSLNTAQHLANALLNAQKNGQSYDLGESEATPTMREEFSSEKQIQTYSAIQELFGDYQSITFVEAYRTTTTPTYQIFRFRGTFEDETTQPEVRVVLNDSTQLAGFDIRPWQESL